MRARSPLCLLFFVFACGVACSREGTRATVLSTGLPTSSIVARFVVAETNGGALFADAWLSEAGPDAPDDHLAYEPHARVALAGRDRLTVEDDRGVSRELEPFEDEEGARYRAVVDGASDHFTFVLARGDERHVANVSLPPTFSVTSPVADEQRALETALRIDYTPAKIQGAALHAVTLGDCVVGATTIGGPDDGPGHYPLWLKGTSKEGPCDANVVMSAESSGTLDPSFHYTDDIAQRSSVVARRSRRIRIRVAR